ncbi:maleylpyruvate isomerase family mycothiol-dependent enzyme [Rhodococcoides fascians A25f]|uniref:maleylpyruvate isomerase family mycothiol-dependent enzyme n=1 Tax=Rhodococcoides fascians TaxID=1828 RepID=UPI000690E31F|nr:maleylpyruvate isomerase family mycothiol-dependent enzyme [Rhodococcus fascians]QII04327.1 maleylpyruvate isomerase family mycothiol-dependent enzyme [Rhodococcus fascians A25f]
MTSRTQIETGISQVTALLSAVTEDERASATPCTDWTVADLTDHLVHTATNLVTMARGDEIDWSASPEPSSDPIPLWTESTRELLAEIDAGSPLPLGMVAAEFSVHAWDLATALGRGTDDLDQTVPEEGMVFMSANMTDERRGGAFDPEQPAPDDANAYERLAAFAGRTVQRS